MTDVIVVSGSAPRKLQIIDPEKEMAATSATSTNSPRRTLSSPGPKSRQPDAARLQLMRRTLRTMRQYGSKDSDPPDSAKSETSEAVRDSSDYQVVPGGSESFGQQGKEKSQAGWILEETKKLFERQRERRENALKVADHVLLENQLSSDSRRSPRRKKFQGQNFDDEEEKLQDWLKKNSLIAKRLTIIDALSKTLITQKPMSVPSIDKVVLSRVFDDILPISYATSSQRQNQKANNEIHLVNPAAVDLKSYEDKLTQTIQTFYRKLDWYIWQRLPNMERQGYSNIPPNWETDRGVILESLQRCNWPVTREEIQLIDDEIELGKKFLQQSIDLRLCCRNSSKRSPDRQTSKTARDVPGHQLSSRLSARRTQRPQSARRTVSLRGAQTYREEITAKVELSQDEINLVQMYREKLHSARVGQRSTKPKIRKDISPPVRRKVAQPLQHVETNRNQRPGETSHNSSDSYTSSHSSTDWPTDREADHKTPNRTANQKNSDKGAGPTRSKNSSPENEQEIKTEESASSEKPLLHNILKNTNGMNKNEEQRSNTEGQGSWESYSQDFTGLQSGSAEPLKSPDPDAEGYMKHRQLDRKSSEPGRPLTSDPRQGLKGGQEKRRSVAASSSAEADAAYSNPEENSSDEFEENVEANDSFFD